MALGTWTILQKLKIHNERWPKETVIKLNSVVYPMGLYLIPTYNRHKINKACLYHSLNTGQVVLGRTQEAEAAQV